MHWFFLFAIDDALLNLDLDLLALCFSQQHQQAALLVTNGLAVLNNDRCLEKCE